MLEKELEKIGLSDKEAKVYISALELGFSPVQNIAEKAGINRSTTYIAIEGLIEKGLMSQFEKDKKRYFAAENPDNLERIYNLRQQQLKQEQESVFGLLPELKALFNFGTLKPKVRYFEGTNGIYNILDEILETRGKMIKGFTNLDDLNRHFPNHDNDYVSKRVEQGICTKSLYTRKAGPINDASNEKLLREARFIPLDQYPLGADLTIAVDKIAIVSFYKEPIIGIIIEDKGLATTIDTLFELSWVTAQKYNK